MNQQSSKQQGRISGQDLATQTSAIID